MYFLALLFVDIFHSLSPSLCPFSNHIWLQLQLKIVTLDSGCPKWSKRMQVQSLWFISKSVTNHSSLCATQNYCHFCPLWHTFLCFIVPLSHTVFPLFPVTDVATFGDIASSEWVLHSNFRSYTLEIQDFCSSQYSLPGRLVNSDYM